MGTASFAEVVLLLVLLSNYSLVAAARVRAGIWRVAAQGVVVGAVPLLHPDGVTLRAAALAAAILLLKGFVFPKLLARSARVVGVSKESKPTVGYAGALVFETALLATSFWAASSLARINGHAHWSALMIPTALATLLSGLLLIVSRREALMQVVGYIVLENGIFLLGIGLVPEQPFLIELGILLDVFVGVFVMGIAVFHISRTFDHIDVVRLSELKD